MGRYQLESDLKNLLAVQILEYLTLRITMPPAMFALLVECGKRTIFTYTSIQPRHIYGQWELISKCSMQVKIHLPCTWLYECVYNVQF